MSETRRPRACFERVARLDIALFLACCVVFAAFPRLDIAVNRWLHTPEAGFFWAEHPVVQWLYYWMEMAAVALLLAALVAWLVASLWGWFVPSATARFWRRAGSFVVVVALLGPLLMVNGVFKEHWGRARPNDVAAFGGDSAYTPPLQPAAQCDSNCSFVSGHASAGFLFMALAWALRYRGLLVLGIVLGVAAGFGRMAQGDHFLSDVIFSFWVVWFCCVVLGRLWYGDDGRHGPAKRTPESAAGNS